MAWKNWGDHPLVVAVGIVAGLSGVVSLGYTIYEHHLKGDTKTNVTALDSPSSPSAIAPPSAVTTPILTTPDPEQESRSASQKVSSPSPSTTPQENETEQRPLPSRNTDANSQIITKIDYRTFQWKGDLEISLNQALERANRGFEALGVRGEMVEQSPQKVIVTTSTEPGLRSTGETIKVVLETSNSQQVNATVISQSAWSTTLFDWGKNRDNIEKIVQFLTESRIQ